MKIVAVDLPAITFSRLSAWLSNSSGVGSRFSTMSLTFLPAGITSSAGSNLWFSITSLNSSSAARAGAASRRQRRAGASRRANMVIQARWQSMSTNDNDSHLCLQGVSLTCRKKQGKKTGSRAPPPRLRRRRLLGREPGRIERERLRPQLLEERIDVARPHAMAVMARRVDQPFVDRRREVVEVGIQVEIVGDLRDPLQVDHVDVRERARRVEDVALERERHVELATLDIIGPDDDRIRRPDKVEFRLRMTFEKRQNIACEAHPHGVDLEHRVRELRIEVARIEMTQHVGAREMLLVRPPPRGDRVGAKALGGVARHDPPRLDEHTPRKQIRKVVERIAIVQVRRQRSRERVP